MPCSASYPPPGLNLKKPFTSFLHRLLFPAILTALFSFSVAAEPASTTLQFESLQSEGDFVIAYNSDRIPHAKIALDFGADSKVADLATSVESVAIQMAC